MLMRLVKNTAQQNAKVIRNIPKGSAPNLVTSIFVNWMEQSLRETSIPSKSTLKVS